MTYDAEMKRFLPAFVIAPLVAPALYWVLAIVSSLADPNRRGAALRSPFDGIVWIFVVGSPLAYAAALLAAVPAYFLLRRLGRRALGPLLLLGAVCGILTALILRPYLRADLFSLVLTPLQGAIMGAGSAAVFWWLNARSARPASAVGAGP